MPLLMEPEDAATAILSGVRRGLPVVRFPQLASLAMTGLSFLPPRLLDKLYRA